MSPQIRMLLLIAVLTALAAASPFWAPLFDHYWRGVFAGLACGWLLRGLVDRALKLGPQ